MTSLKSRMSYATIVLLIGSAVVLATLLTEAFRKTLAESERNRLEGIVYTVLSMVDVIGENELWFDDTLLVDSAQGADIVITNSRGDVLWPGQSDHKENILRVGEWKFDVQKHAEHRFIL
ncbi:MAG: hypothetical protein KDK51_05955 [Deltaproteobacteria bacterium]|nr:hypothetical protein [Deltaproteobacteria bacterium]